jgi:hypothetical protein
MNRVIFGQNTQVKRFSRFAALAALMVLSGCKASDFMGTVGQYNGILTEKSGATTVQSSATASITSPAYLSLDVKVNVPQSSDTPARSWDFAVVASRNGSVSITDKADNNSIPLKPAADGCYMNTSASAAADATTRLCYQSNQVTLDVTPVGSATSLSFLMNRVSTTNSPPLEAPADYTLSQLSKRAVNQSFTSEIEFESVVQAHLSAQAAHLALLPNFSFGTITSLAGLTASFGTDMLSLVRLIGNLAPFLIPSNWFLAKEATFQSDAEKYGYLLMKADSGNIATGLAYDIARDSLSINTMQIERAKIADVREDVADRESLGFAPAGSTDAIDSVLNSCDKVIIALQQTLAQEYVSLAQASGFVNPRAVRSVSIDNNLSIDNPVTFDEATAEQQALQQASELTQMDYLIAAAKVSKTEKYFDWLNPSGGSGSASISFAMGSYIAIAASQVRQLEDKRQQLQSTILATVVNNNTALANAIANYKLSLKNIVVQDDLVNSLINNMQLGVQVSVTDLMTAYAGQMQAQLDKNNAQFEYLVSLDNMQRSLYAGPYQGLGNDSGGNAPAAH